MVAATPVPVSTKTQEALTSYYTHIKDIHKEFRDSLRTRMEDIDKAYQREGDISDEHQQAKLANKLGNKKEFQNMTVPVVMPQVETAVTYQTSVFLTGYPLFGVVADPAYMDEAMQLETVIEDQAKRGGWTRELMMFFRNGEKYNFAPLEVSWGEEVTAAVETNPQNYKEGKAKQVIWSGNKIKALDPYNTIVDPRVVPTELYKNGEFGGYTEFMTRIQLKALVASLPTTIIGNLDDAYASATGNPFTSDITTDGFYLPNINTDVIKSTTKVGGTNWMEWARLADSRMRFDYKACYEVTTLYVRILPSEFSLVVPNRNTPQIYKLIFVNHKHLIYCERQTNIHNHLPILIGQPNEDGLRYQTKSKATNAQPFQEVASAYMNSILHSRRRAVTDRVLYDPSRVTPAHMNSDNPSAKIPVRPSAYGKNISDAVYQFPYREDQASFSMQQIQQLLALSNQLNGQNQASQGQFVKGNKTLEEFDRVMQNANGRDQMTSILYEAQIFTPMKEILKTNILQYQGGTTIYNRDKKKEVEVDPVKLRKAILEFKISDGLLPNQKLIDGDTLSVVLQQLGSSPQLSAGYNLTPLFSYLVKTKGGMISDFEKSPEQIAYEQALQSWENLALEGIKNGIDSKKLPPQPKPAEFGYVPANNKPAPDEAKQQNTDQTGTLV